jgi:hypothetical protein
MNVQALDIKSPKEARLDLNWSSGSRHMSRDHPYRGFRHQSSEKEVLTSRVEKLGEDWDHPFEEDRW